MTDNEAPREPDAPAYLNEKQLAQRFGMSVKWIQAARYKGGGVPYCQFGNRVRYPIAAVEEYELEHLRKNSSDSGPGSLN
jgi:AraC-like DNA-binding protein